MTLPGCLIGAGFSTWKRRSEEINAGLPRPLALLEEALKVGRCPERYLIKKGFTLEVLGEYERAVETLLKAKPLVEQQGDSRLLYIQRFNLAVNYCHLGRYAEAGELAQRVRALAAERGDETELVRIVWLGGRIAAGLGRPEEARRLLAQARREFSARGMGYDMALALLEEAVLLLEEGRTAEVRALTPSLAEVFDSKGVHREDLAALRLFREAAEREEATAELARSVLDYLFRARDDQGLRLRRQRQACKRRTKLLRAKVLAAVTKRLILAVWRALGLWGCPDTADYHP